MQVAAAPLLIQAKHLSLDVDMVIKAAGQVPFEKLITKYKLNNKNGKLLLIKIVQQILKEYLPVAMQ